MVNLIESNLTKVNAGLGNQIRKTLEVQVTIADNYTSPFVIDLSTQLKGKELIRVIPESPVFTMLGVQYTIEVLHPISGQTFSIKLFDVATGNELPVAAFPGSASIFFEVTQDT